MFIYFCEKYKKFEAFKSKTGNFKCPDCGGEYLPLGVTVDEWNEYSNDEMLDAIERAKNPVVIKTPVFKKTTEAGSNPIREEDHRQKIIQDEDNYLRTQTGQNYEKSEESTKLEKKTKNEKSPKQSIDVKNLLSPKAIIFVGAVALVIVVSVILANLLSPDYKLNDYGKIGKKLKVASEFLESGSDNEEIDDTTHITKNNPSAPVVITYSQQSLFDGIASVQVMTDEDGVINHKMARFRFHDDSWDFKFDDIYEGLLRNCEDCYQRLTEKYIDKYGEGENVPANKDIGVTKGIRWPDKGIEIRLYDRMSSGMYDDPNVQIDITK